MVRSAIPTPARGRMQRTEACRAKSRGALRRVVNLVSFIAEEVSGFGPARLSARDRASALRPSEQVRAAARYLDELDLMPL